MGDSQTDFGYRRVSSSDKDRLVGRVFDSVAMRYDLMNDLMSLGAHRLWKRFAISRLGLKNGHRVLDLAGGTGDMTLLCHRLVAPDGIVTLADINGSMLSVGRNRLIDRGLVSGVQYVQTSAEHLSFAGNQFDAVIIAFGLRNVTDKLRALEEMYRVVRPGRPVVILEFSKLSVSWLQRLYDVYSFRLLPQLGQWVAGDRDSYQYLVESIRRHPNQETLAGMMRLAGFERVVYHNLTAGAVAVHQGVKL
jgi:demethylmenaquinone methyltransferase/2-methoxy-6-polyprenyl-1,4-benzoquinol methylase